MLRCVQASLAALALDNNDVRDEGAKALLQAVQTNQGLVQLRFDNTNTSAEVSRASKYEAQP